MNVGCILKSKGRAVSTVRPNVTLLDVVKKLVPKKIGAVVVVVQMEGSAMRSYLATG